MPHAPCHAKTQGAQQEDELSPSPGDWAITKTQAEGFLIISTGLGNHQVPAGDRFSPISKKEGYHQGPSRRKTSRYDLHGVRLVPGPQQEKPKRGPALGNHP